MHPFVNVAGRDFPTYMLFGVLGVAAGFLFAFIRIFSINRKCPDKYASVEIISTDSNAIIYSIINMADAMFMMLFACIGMLIGAKLLSVVQNIPNIIRDIGVLKENPELFLTAYFANGFVFYGGLAGSVAGMLVYNKMYKINTAAYIRVLIPVIPLTHSIARVGCLFAGCCYGIPFEPPVGMMLNKSPSAPHGVYLFPVQLLESVCNLVIFAAVFIYTAKSPKKYGGLSLYLVLYSTARFFIEFLRYDRERGFIGPLSTSQFISLFVFAAGLIIYFFPDKYLKSSKK